MTLYYWIFTFRLKFNFKRTFWHPQFFQKTNKKIPPNYYDTSDRIVRFLDVLKTPKRHLEINWPLSNFVTNWDEWIRCAPQRPSSKYEKKYLSSRIGPQLPQWPQWLRQPLFIKKLGELDVFINFNPITKIIYPGLSMWNGLSKIHYLMDFWHLSCWRLWRP